ncbi:MAG: recombinase family protein [Lachnospiraceae bacterium]|nr:recombinase family protein [Lachnospiraceae bacterium]
MKVRIIPRTRDLRKKRVAAYCRVSTIKQDQENSLETQRSYYTAYIRSHPDWEFAGIYHDEKSATGVKKRPGFQRMVQDAAEGRIDMILVKSISRFSRNIVDCQNYARYLRGNGVEVRFEKENLSTADPSADMMFALLGSVAQSESQANSERTRWGISRRMERGEYNIGNNRILGYDTVNGKLVPNQDAWIIRLIFDRFLAGDTYQQIADLVYRHGGHRLRSDRPLGTSNIQSILRNETYAGDRHLQKQPPVHYITKRPNPTAEYKSYYLKDNHKAIIDRETWEKVQGVLDGRRRKKT